MAQSKQEVVDALVAQSKEVPLAEIVQHDCAYRRYDDQGAFLLFSALKDAQAQCRDATLKATQTLQAEFPGLAESLVLPSITTTLQEGPVTTGQTKFGGLPDTGPGFSWPSSASLTVQAAMRDYVDTLGSAPVAADANAPMTFVAQLDLATLSKLDADFPTEGRLLVFMDWGAWFSESYTSGATVLWDQTPIAALTKAKSPKTLAWMDDVATGKTGDLGGMRLPISLFVAPEIPVTLAQDWTDIRTNALDYEDTAYAKRVAELGAADIYLNGYLYEVLDKSYYEDEPETYPPQHQISGVPMPEQDDPRYDAVFLSVMGRLYGSPEDVAAFEAKLGLTGDALQAHQKAEALKYKLLLQLDVASFMQINGEGHFYFLLHEDDLKARNFDKVMVIYQQT